MEGIVDGTDWYAQRNGQVDRNRGKAQLPSFLQHQKYADVQYSHGGLTAEAITD